MVDSDEEDSVSFRMVLPSESHRKQSKGRLRSAGDSVSSLATSHGDLSGVCTLLDMFCIVQYGDMLTNVLTCYYPLATG